MPIKFSAPIPQLPVLSVADSTAYYRDVLGFKIDWTWGENDYASVSRDSAVIFLSAADGGLEKCVLFQYVGDVDALHAEWSRSGAKILADPEDKPWGIREFTIEDNNGHQLRIAQSSRKFDLPDRQSLPDTKLAHRIPSIEEHRALLEAVAWTSFTNFDAAALSLEKSLHCTIAEVNGAFAGMARICGDGQQYFYIMDVAVFPEHQGRGIGTALMNDLADWLERNAPEKALVTLFTGAGRASFYERFGFKGPDTGLYGMSTGKMRRS
jgi:GNAT superfamily N-acetyltransferase/uncharacterized glyoxalase superfamily protein PhnB